MAADLFFSCIIFSLLSGTRRHEDTKTNEENKENKETQRNSKNKYVKTYFLCLIRQQ